MDPSTLLIALIVFGVVSYFIEKIYGVNPYNVYIAIIGITIFFSILYIINPVMHNTDPSAILTSTDRLNNWLTKFLPGAIIGDLAGIFIGKITRGYKR